MPLAITIRRLTYHTHKAPHYNLLNHTHTLLNGYKYGTKQPYQNAVLNTTKQTRSLSSMDKKPGPLPSYPTVPWVDKGLGLDKGPGASSGVLQGSGEVPKDGLKKVEDWNDILNRWYQQYQAFVGIMELKNAQDRVTELTEGMLQAQGERRRLQAEIEELQTRLGNNHDRITKTEQYSQEHMRLFSEARELNEKLRGVRQQFSYYEDLERDTFTHMSAAIRDCHEKERMQAEQSKYWSIIASVVSAALASVITSINNWWRIREIKEHVSTSHSTLLQGYQQMHADILTSLAPLTHPGNTTTPPEASTHPTTKEIAEEIVVAEIRQVRSEITEVAKGLNGLFGDAKEMLATVSSVVGPATVPSSVEGVGGASRGVGGGAGDVGYARVAGTMMVGAALGTLFTAFFLGALGGYGG